LGSPVGKAGRREKTIMASSTTEQGTSGASQGFPTEHPHIERRPGVCGGAPIIRGTRITVRHIAVLYKDGAGVEEVLATYPHLQASWVHDAISYFLDHREEIEREIEANRIDEVLARTGGVIDDKGVVRFPPGKAGDE
jgi:uncharacterized protein (DUF433 family)